MRLARCSRGAGAGSLMTFSDVLQIVAGWVGREVHLEVEDGASCAFLVSLTGVLGPALEVERAVTADERLVFPIGDDDLIKITFDRSVFNGAEGDEWCLEVLAGGTRLHMAPLILE